MPLIDARLIDRLIEAFAPDRGNLIAVPVSDGRRGNPVLWSRRFFNELMTLDGDIGARHLIARHGEAVAEVPVEGHGAFLDIDTPQALGARAAEPVRITERRLTLYGRVVVTRRPPCAGERQFQPLVHQVETSLALDFRRHDLGGGDFDRFDRRRATPRAVCSCADLGARRIALRHRKPGRRARSRSANAAPTARPMTMPARPARGRGAQAMQGRVHRGDHEARLCGVVGRHGQSLRRAWLCGRSRRFPIRSTKRPANATNSAARNA